MAKYLKVGIFFDNKQVADVLTSSPFSEILVTGVEANQVKHIFPEMYLANINGKITEVYLKNPAMYLAFLYQFMTGAYWRAGPSKVVDIELPKNEEVQRIKILKQLPPHQEEFNLSSLTRFSRWLELQKSPTQLIRGKKGTTSVKAILTNPEGKVLLLRAPVGGPVKRPTWDLPGGGLHGGETLQDGLKREVFEETGIRIAPEKPVLVQDITFPEAVRPVIFFAAVTLQESVVLSNEHDAYRWVNLLELDNYAMFGEMREVIQNLLDTESKQVEKTDSGGGIIALAPPERVGQRLAVEGGIPAEDFHITIIFSPFEDRDEEWLKVVSESLSNNASPSFTGKVKGLDRFEGVKGGTKDAIVELVDIDDFDALTKWREDIKITLRNAGFEVSEDHAFTPHMTLSYVDVGEESSIKASKPFDFPLHVEVWVNSKHLSVPLEKQPLTFNKASPYSRSICMERGCEESPTVEFLWAEGMAHCWLCNEHAKDFRKREIWHNVSQIDAERNLKYGIASKRWKDGVPTKAQAEEYFELHKGLLGSVKKMEPPRQGLVPKSGDWQHPDHWILPESERRKPLSRSFSEQESAKAWISSQSGKWISSATERQKHALAFYTTGYDINQTLREGRFSTGPAFIRKQIKAIDEVFSFAAIDEGVITYRGIESSRGRTISEYAVKGALLVDQAYVSTSLLKDVASRFSIGVGGPSGILLKIKIPAGTPAIPLGAWGSPEEAEILLPRGSAFKVVGLGETYGFKRPGYSSDPIKISIVEVELVTPSLVPLKKLQPPRQGLIPKSGDWEHPDHWILPEGDGSVTDAKGTSAQLDHGVQFVAKEPWQLTRAEWFSNVEYGTEPAIVTLTDSFSDPMSMREEVSQGKVKAGLVEGGDGFIYNVQGTEVTLVPGLRARFDYDMKDFVVTKKSKPINFFKTPLFHRTSNPKLTLSDLRPGKSFGKHGMNEYSGIYFETNPQGPFGKNIIEARIMPTANVVSLHEAPSSTEEALKQGIDVITTKEKDGEFDEVIVLNPKVLRIGPHEEGVIKAVSEGKTVPDKVLADYPNLITKLKNIRSSEIQKQGPPRQGLVPKSRDWEHPDHWILPESERVAPSQEQVGMVSPTEITSIPLKRKTLEGIPIPPKWTRVEISSNPKSALQATGYDEKGRKQYLYSSTHSKKAAANKFSRIKEFDKRLPALRDKIKKDLQTNESAVVLYLIDQTGFRIGSDSDIIAKVKAYGVSTLQKQHVSTTGDKVTFGFIGKKGVAINKTVEDAVLARIIEQRSGGKARQDRLFSVTEGQVLHYLQTMAKRPFLIKDFRTWRGTATAIRVMKDIPAPTSKSGLKKAKNLVAKAVAADLGNTPAVSLKSYIQPEVFAPWEKLTLSKGEDLDFDIFRDVHYDDIGDWTQVPEEDLDDDEDVSDEEEELFDNSAEDLRDRIDDQLEKIQPPRQGLVPKSGDWEHPDHWVLPEEEKSRTDVESAKELPPKDFSEAVTSGKKWGTPYGHKWFGILTKQELDGVFEYKKESHRLNGYLRSGILYEEGDAFFEDWAVKLDSALKKGSFDEDVAVYRSIPNIQKVKGKTFVDKGFLSTSLDMFTPRALGKPYAAILKIAVKKGTPAAYLDVGVSDFDENEVLLPRGLLLSVESKGTPHVFDSGYTVYVYNAEIGPPKSNPGNTPVELKKTGWEIELSGQPDAYTNELYSWADSQLEKAEARVEKVGPENAKVLGQRVESRLYTTLQGEIEDYLNSLVGTESEEEILTEVHNLLNKWQAGSVPLVESTFKSLFTRGFIAGAIASGFPGKLGSNDVNALKVLEGGKYRIGESIKLFRDDAVKEFSKIISEAYTPEGTFSLDSLVSKMKEAVPAQRYKLERIARTETSQVSNIGRLWAWNEDPDKYFYNYFWNSTPDNRVKDISRLRSTYNPLTFDEAKFLWFNQAQQMPNGKFENDVFNQRCTLSRSPVNDEVKGNRFEAQSSMFSSTSDILF